MNSRFAQLIAQSLGPDGRPDPARLCEALRIAPDDPVAVIVEGVLASRDIHEQARAELSAVLETERTRLQESFQKHAERVGIATQAIDAFAATTEKARTENSEDLRARSDDIRRLAETLNRTAATIAGRALINVFLAGIVCGGVCGAALVFILRK